MIRELGLIKVLIAVGGTKSMTNAARVLGLSPSAVSKAVSRLEAAIGTRLVLRTSRRVALTDNGLRLYERFCHIMEELEQAESDVAVSRTSLRGRLKIQMPIAFGRRILLPALWRFASEYPHVELNVELSDRVSDLSEERLDVAVRIGDVGDARLVARKLCTLRYVVCGSPAYLAANPEPRTPEDLVRHRCLAYYNPHTGRYRDWNFCKRGTTSSKTVHGTLNFNNTESLLDAAIAGLGLVAVSTFVAEEAVRAGKLRTVLDDYLCAGKDVFAVCLPHHATVPRVKALMKCLEIAIPTDPLWDRIVGERTRSSRTRTGRKSLRNR